MKRILILCDAFGPPSYTPRIRFLCQYLADNGWDVTLCTEKFSPLTFPHSYLIDEIPFYHHDSILGSIEWAIKSMLSLMGDYKNKYFSKKVRQKYKHQHFDLIVCSTFHTFPLRAAYELAQEKNIPWAADLRDISEQAPGNQYHAHQSPLLSPIANWFKVCNIIRRNKLIQKAHLLSTVSPWHVEFLKTYNPTTHLIYNGFDDTVFYPQTIKQNKFIFSYTGKLYEESMQNPELFFAALRDLSEIGILNPDHCMVQWYTSSASQETIKRWAKTYQVEHFMDYIDYVNPKQINTILNQSSIVLVFSNRTRPEGPHGIMTTKFFEALGAERPVLCVRSDESCLAAAINNTNAGIAATTLQEVKSFISDKYTEWTLNGYTRQEVIKEQKNYFSRQSQAKQFEELFKNLIANHKK